MSAIPLVWSESRPIESFDVDVNGRLRAAMLFGLLTNAAWKHAAFSEHGYEGLSERNQMWVLSRFQLAVTRVARWGEQLVIETWGKGTERLYALRDYMVTLADGTAVAAATSAWLILDQATRRPMRMDQLVFPSNPGRAALKTDLRKVEAPTDGRAAGRFQAAFSDIDPNGHVTAMKYLAWMLDSHDAPFLTTNVPRTIDLSFLGEGALGDEVSVKIDPREGFELCSVSRESDGRELCRARVEWAPDEGRPSRRPEATPGRG